MSVGAGIGSSAKRPPTVDSIFGGSFLQNDTTFSVLERQSNSCCSYIDENCLKDNEEFDYETTVKASRPFNLGNLTESMNESTRHFIMMHHNLSINTRLRIKNL